MAYPRGYRTVASRILEMLRSQPGTPVDLCSMASDLGIKSGDDYSLRNTIKVHVCFARRQLVDGESIAAQYVPGRSRSSYVLLRNSQENMN